MYIASASTVVKFHEFPSNQLIHTYHPTYRVEGPCRSLSWTKDGMWLAVVPYSGSTEIVTLKGQCKLLHTVNNVSEPSCASFQNLTKRNIAVGTKHGQVLLYDIKSRQIKARYPRTSSAITHVGFTAKDTHCFAGCVNGDILLYNNVAKNLCCTLKVPKSHSLTDVRAHAQRRNVLVGGSNEGIICVWDVNANKTKFQTEAHSGPVTATIFSPVNSALILSAGLDRLVRVFDTESRSRITSIPVENNVLSLDFVEDSSYIIMGSQNGKIHVYDSRSLQDPVCSFEAHESAVKHIAYQMGSEDPANNSSLGSVVAEEALSRPSKSSEEVEARRKRTSDFFELVVQGPSISETFDGAKQHNLSSMEGDSFMHALGLDKDNTQDSLKDDSYHEVDSKVPTEKNRLSVNMYNTPNAARIVHEKLGLSKNSIQSTSTPLYLSQNLVSQMSPIVPNISMNQSRTPVELPAASVTEIQNITKHAMQEELTKALAEMETKIVYSFKSETHQIRRMILNLHMANLKEFIKVENYFNHVIDDIRPEQTIEETYLLEENMNLKKRIQELEREVANLKNRDENANA